MTDSQSIDLLRPVTNVRLVPRDSLKPNDYNPNAVLPENLKLLIQSILTNGWTMPIVVRPDMEIIDGYHRWMVSGIEPLLSRLGGMVPIAVVEHADEDANVYGTITHNRARGVHQLGPMKAIVKRLMDNGKTVPEIGRQLGMRPEEVFRLSDFSRAEFLEMMTKGDHKYSEASTLVNV
jgi:ParB-like chromosome segregation protein Spo0J